MTPFTPLTPTDASPSGLAPPSACAVCSGGGALSLFAPPALLLGVPSGLAAASYARWRPMSPRRCCTARRRSLSIFAAEGPVQDDGEPDGKDGQMPADEGMSRLNPAEMEYMNGW